MIKYGVIGTGWITREFIEGSKAVGGLELSAVYSRTLEKGMEFAQQFGCNHVYTDLNDFAKSPIDAVYIASPNSFHYEQSKFMLLNGKHVICEKPITVTPEELSELQGIAKQKGLVYMEAIMYLYSPARARLIEAIKKIGNITSAHFDFSQLSSKYQEYKNGELPNIFNPKFATGCLMDLGIYCVYPTLDFFGMPERIISCAGLMKSKADGFGSSIIVYPDKQITLTYSKLGQSQSPSQILGDKGTIKIGSISQLNDIKTIYNDGSVETVTERIPKVETMSFEAQGFYLYITQQEKYSEIYDYASDLALNVNKTLKIIRKQCSIRF
ncbi:MAG TPA: Gfo/Idh/MocA family oxidoreductase [Clostridia bacterium]|nr:Gfo/Idh/MocA family oxidoreductase [Clostridia bacterium]